MTEPYVGQIMISAFNFAPKYWAKCDGQLMSTAQNQPLFAMLGTTYGGNGNTTFALPDFRGRVAIGDGSRPGDPDTFALGQRVGSESHTLLQNEVDHTHSAAYAVDATKTSPAGALFAIGSAAVYGTNATDHMASGLVGNSGGAQPHTNMQPYLALNFSIALAGIFPSR